MRSFVALVGLPITLAAAAITAESTGHVDVANTIPAKTADWYKQHDQPLPKVSEDITVVEDGKSYVVKVDCLGCPFHAPDGVEQWPRSTQENSLLLNFTIDNSIPAILLNGETVVPIAERPPNVRAYQVPANTSAEIMDKIVSLRALDDSRARGTKYGRFELQYEHTLLATELPNEEWLQFDVTGIHLRSTQIPESYKLTQEGQKMVQFLFGQEIHEDQTTTVTIRKIDLVERKDRHTPIKMKCGKLAMVQTEYNPLEWDYYGKIGTWPRTFAKASSKTFHFIESNALVLIVLAVVFGLYKFIVTWRIVARRRAEAAQAKDQQDAELALLTSPDFDDDDYDAPPDYDNVPAADARKEDEQ